MKSKLTNLKELYNRRERKWELYFMREKKIKMQIEELEKKKKGLRFNSTFDSMFHPFAEELKKRLKADSYEWYGHFGICSELTIYFTKGSRDITKKGAVVGRICFTDGGRYIRDTTKKTYRYRKGTIGEVNGMNHPKIKVTEEMDIAWLEKWAKR